MTRRVAPRPRRSITPAPAPPADEAAVGSPCRSGDNAEGDERGHGELRVLESTGSKQAIGASQFGVCLGPYVQRRLASWVELSARKPRLLAPAPRCPSDNAGPRQGRVEDSRSTPAAARRGDWFACRTGPPAGPPPGYALPRAVLGVVSGCRDPGRAAERSYRKHARVSGAADVTRGGKLSN